MGMVGSNFLLLLFAVKCTLGHKTLVLAALCLSTNRGCHWKGKLPDDTSQLHNFLASLLTIARCREIKIQIN